MTDDVTVPLGGLCALNTVGAAGVTLWGAPIVGVTISGLFVAVLTLAFFSPIGPTVLFDVPEVSARG